MIVALVCGRSEEKPFRGRNTFPLLDRPLMLYPILAAQNSINVTQVYLTTDDPGMMRIASHAGAEIIERPRELASGSTTIETVIEHGYREIVRRSNDNLDALVILIANAPTVTNGLIDQGVEMLMKRPELDAVMSVSLHNEYQPHYALALGQNGLLEPLIEYEAKERSDAYFPDSLLWVLRPEKFFNRNRSSINPNWIVNVADQKIAALVHEGYGDVDHAYQIPMYEEWLRRRGFTETSTPYTWREEAPSLKPSLKIPAVPKANIERRALITTVPFGESNPRPIEFLKQEGINYEINPIGRRLKESELIELIADYGILIAGTEPITAKVMTAAPQLRLISRVGIGLDNVDLQAARERGINVTYTPDAPSPAVAELTVGLMISLLRDLAGTDRNMRNGIWHRFMGKRLSQMTVGIIGVGRIGKRVIQHLVGGFQDIHILANDLQPDLEFGKMYGIQWVEKEQIYRQSDLITLHVPLTSLTRRLIAHRELVTFKPGSLLINTSRGGVVDEHDLADSLRAGHLGGAAVDVYEREPYSGELSMVERCLLTCHMGSMTLDCRHQMELEAVEEVIRFLRSEPLKNPVPESEYLLSEKKQ